MVVRFIFSSILQIQFVEVRISWSSSESPLDFEITIVDCNSACNIHYDYRNSRWQSCVRLNCRIVSHGYMYDYTTGPSCISIRILAPGSPMSLVSLTIGLPVVSSYSGPRLFESSILLKNTTISSEQVMWTVSWENVPSNTIDSRYLELAYLEKPLISKWKSGPCFNTDSYQKATKYCGKEEKLLLRSNFSSFPQYFQYIS